jgi:hypothetical protein
MTMGIKTDLRIAFWGTSRFSIIVLEEMAREGMLPSLIVTAPAKQKGRGLELAPSEVKVWADTHHIPTLEPYEIRSEEFAKTLGSNWDLFLVVSYGKIIRVRSSTCRTTAHLAPLAPSQASRRIPYPGRYLRRLPCGKTSRSRCHHHAHR